MGIYEVRCIRLEEEQRTHNIPHIVLATRCQSQLGKPQDGQVGLISVVVPPNLERHGVCPLLIAVMRVVQNL